MPSIYFFGPVHSAAILDTLPPTAHTPVLSCDTSSLNAHMSQVRSVGSPCSAFMPVPSGAVGFSFQKDYIRRFGARCLVKPVSLGGGLALACVSKGLWRRDRVCA